MQTVRILALLQHFIFVNGRRHSTTKFPCWRFPAQRIPRTKTNADIRYCHVTSSKSGISRQILVIKNTQYEISAKTVQPL
jgi:hypothetical protein